MTKHKTRRHRQLWMLAAVILAVSVAVPVVAANLTGSLFETDDGNTIVNTAGNLDWDNVLAVVKADKPSGQNDDSFGNGTKEDTAVPSLTTGSIPPNKSDLKEFGSYIEKAANGKQYLHLFWTRVQDPSGTTNMDFEFNEKICTEDNTSGCSSNGVTPLRTEGDLLITYDLSRGGTVATISLRFWGGSAWGPAQALDPATATGSINTTTITTNINGVPGTYSPRTFGEASINLTDTIFDATACQSFGGAYLKSRASDSFTSALKDFIAPIGVDLTNCGRVVVHKVEGSTTGPLLDGATFGISPATKGEPPETTLDRLAAGIYCAEDLLIGTQYTITETVVPVGYNGSAPQTFTPTEEGTCGTVRTVANGGPITPANLTFVNTLKTGTLKLQKTVVNNNGGNAEADDFQAKMNGTDVDWGEVKTFTAGTVVTATETTLAGYTAGTWGGDCAADGTVTIVAGVDKVCTITNDDNAPSLTLVKQVINNNGGTAVASDWTLTATGYNAASPQTGTYNLSESGPAGYTQTSLTCDNAVGQVTSVTLGLGESVTCTFVNDDNPASPTWSTVQHWVLHDTITLVGIRDGADDQDDATVTFRLFSDETCTTQVGDDEAVLIDSNGVATTKDGVTVFDTGFYYWTVEYSGDDYNQGFPESGCGDEVTQIQAKDAKGEAPNYRNDLIIL
jgi:hypothetical protein